MLDERSNENNLEEHCWGTSSVGGDLEPWNMVFPTLYQRVKNLVEIKS